VGIIDKLLGGGVKSIVDGVVSAVDRFIETPDEKRQWEEIKAKMIQESMQWQAEINKIEAAHRSIFVAGWRPMIGWICAATLAWHWVLAPILKLFMVVPEMPMNDPLALVMALLGVASLRTAEKIKNVTQ